MSVEKKMNMSAREIPDRNTGIFLRDKPVGKKPDFWYDDQQ